MEDSKHANNPELVLVVGATGELGSEIVRQLCGSGKSVRAVVRKTADSLKRARIANLPVEVIDADLTDHASLDDACSGVTTVVSTATAIMSRSNSDTIQTVDEVGQMALVDAAKRNGVKRFVYISFIPSPLQYAFQAAKRSVEARLRESGVSYTILQPTAFMEIWLSPAVGFDPKGGNVSIPGDGTNPVSWVSIHDVARFAVAATFGAAFSNQIIPIGGPEALTPLRVVEIFQDLGSPEMTINHIPEPALVNMFEQASDPVQQALAASMLNTARGQVVSSRPMQELLPGRLRTVREYAAQLLGDSAAEK